MPTGDPRALPTSHAMACLEVWGGNHPVDAHVTLAGLEAWVYAVPHANAAQGGDVHFVSSCGSGRISRLCVADVSGHGAAVAKTAVRLRDLMRRYVNHIDQRQFLTQMNSAFRDEVSGGRFATAVVTTFFAPTRRLSLCNAGHPPPLLFRARDRAWDVLDRRIHHDDPGVITNTPLGVLADAGYLGFEIELHPGDLVCCYTDSLVESRLGDGNFLGTEGLHAILASLGDVEPRQLIPRLLSAMSERGAVLDDDLTVLLFRATGAADRATFLQRMRANARMLTMLVWRDGPFPWPEFNLRNLGGAIFSPLSRRK